MHLIYIYMYVEIVVSAPYRTNEQTTERQRWTIHMAHIYIYLWIVCRRGGHIRDIYAFNLCKCNNNKVKKKKKKSRENRKIEEAKQQQQPKKKKMATNDREVPHSHCIVQRIQCIHSISPKYWLHDRFLCHITQFERMCSVFSDSFIDGRWQLSSIGCCSSWPFSVRLLLRILPHILENGRFQYYDDDKIKRIHSHTHTKSEWECVSRAIDIITEIKKTKKKEQKWNKTCPN